MSIISSPMVMMIILPSTFGSLARLSTANSRRNRAGQQRQSAGKAT